MDKISIIVPVYNVENYLPKCLDSIINQTYKNLEIIVIDDGSTDSSSVICDDYVILDKRIIVLHQENHGLSAARNLGIKIATGRFVGFVDSDDFINTEMFEKMFNRIIETCADVVMCNYVRFGMVNDIAYCQNNAVFKVGENIDNNIRLLLEINNMRFAPCRWNKLFKAEQLKEILPKLDVEIVCGEDVNLTMLVFLKANVVSYINDKLYNYLVRETSIVNLKKLYWDSYERLFEILEKEISCIENSNIMLLFKKYVVDIIKNRVNFAIKNKLQSSNIKLILSNKYFQDYINDVRKSEKRFKTKVYDTLLKHSMIRMIKILVK